MTFVLDKAAIMERLGGDEDIFAALAEIYLQDVDGYCSQLDAALAAGDARALQREAHTVKGLLATLADNDGATLAMEIEVRARAGDCAGLAGQVGSVVERMRSVAAAIREALEG